MAEKVKDWQAKRGDIWHKKILFKYRMKHFGDYTVLHHTSTKLNMNSEELKKLQLPIKIKYQKNPETAIITLRAEGKFGKSRSG